MGNKIDIKKHLILALDLPNRQGALGVARELKGEVEYLKIGKQMFTASGPQLIRELKEMGFKIFLDLKFHDIPNTVASAAIEVARLGVDMFNVHVSGGKEMIIKTVESLTDYCESNNIKKPLVIGVTVLTSLDDEDLKDLGINNTVEDQVALLSKVAKDYGLDGVVASAKEIALVRGICGRDFKLVTPGIRPIWAAKNDQKRIGTPEKAIEAGADYIVVGRPITQAADKVRAVRRLLEKDL
jgi:orotidine-5'-phosphate decarboxylase